LASDRRNSHQKASGNRNYKEPISLPSLKALEKENNPKELLHRLLREACGLKGRSLSKFNVHSAVHLVAENISDFSSLRQLEAFKVFEKDLQESVTTFLEKS
jgi:hypothetical protein